MPKTIDRIDLLPERDVERQDGRFVALGQEPWLSLDLPYVARLAGRFVEIAYRLSFWDIPARPVFRFWRDEGVIDRIGVGPIAGRAIWVGRVPVGTRRISVSPTNRPGPFDFAIESLGVRHWPSLLFDGFRWHPRPARSALLTRLIGWAPESDVNLAWATGSIPLDGYGHWRVAHDRAPDLLGLDRPRFDWAEGPPIRVIVAASADDATLQTTLGSLRAQIYPAWQAMVVGSAIACDDPQIVGATANEVEGVIAGADNGTLSCRLVAGDMLLPGALAIVAEAAHRAPEALILYGDELNRHAGGMMRPALKPGWSPRLLKGGGPYPGRAVFIRDLKTWPFDVRRSFVASGHVASDRLAAIDKAQVEPLRRMLLEVPEPPQGRPPLFDAVAVDPRTTAAIIIPTRNHATLLRAAITSIRARSRPGSFRLVIVDNASTDADALAFLDQLRAETDTSVLGHAGPFNFSQICNEGAAQTGADVLVFLNDDMEVLSDGWLDRLVAHALEPDVGAVGAWLTYPDGRLQHVGVLVGMGESAGHFGALAPGDDPGWMGRNRVPHEISAVTGACLAVARAKFEAVGGFDAEHLPIELSDIDLCLKLTARGWQTIVDPAVHLMHEESASRGGATLRRLAVHDLERAVFTERWRHVLRDDPCFHPGLSLYRWQAALG